MARALPGEPLTVVGAIEVDCRAVVASLVDCQSRVPVGGRAQRWPLGEPGSGRLSDVVSRAVLGLCLRANPRVYVLVGVRVALARPGDGAGCAARGRRGADGCCCKHLSTAIEARLDTLASEVGGLARRHYLAHAGRGPGWLVVIRPGQAPAEGLRGDPPPAASLPASAAAPPIRVAISSRKAVLRECLGALITAEAGIELVGAAKPGQTTIGLLSGGSVGVVLLDLGPVPAEGAAFARHLRTALPGVRVVAFGVPARDHLVGELLAAGVAAVVPEEAAASELVASMRRVAASPAGEDDAGLARACLEARGKGCRRTLDCLTPREIEVLRLLAEGLPAGAVAGRLGLSYKTVATHREHIMSKLRICTLAGLTRLAIREGLVPLDA